MKKNMLIFGHSHVWPIRRALISKTYSPKNVNFEILLCGTQEFPGPTVVYNSAGNQLLNLALSGALSKYPADGEEENYLVSMAQGNNYNALGMLSEGPNFDFHYRGYEGFTTNDDAIMLPFSLVEKMIQKANGEIPDYFKRLRYLNYPKTFILGPPPPPKSDDTIKVLLEKQNADLNIVQIAPASTRMKLWLLQNKLIAAQCEKNKFTFVSGNIRGVSDKEGYLLPKFVKDAVHANHGYAAMMLEQIESLAA